MNKFAIGLLLLLSLQHAFAQCYKDSIVSPTPFMGNNDEIFKLASGSLWQVKYEYEYLYEYYPNVVICPNEGKLLIKGKKLNVQSLSSSRSSGTSSSSVIESQIDGDFNGWEGETVYKLMNGQVWQQASYTYSYSYSFMPKVLIYQDGGRYFMQVSDKKAVQVIRLR
jgi:hypothetical protein